MRLYDRLIQSLLLEMSSGHYNEGDRFLSYRKICQRYQISLPTAKSAISWMASENLLAIRLKSGLYLQPNFRQQSLYLYHKRSQTPTLPVPSQWRYRKFHIARAAAPSRPILMAAFDSLDSEITLWEDIPATLQNSRQKCARGFAQAAQQQGAIPLFITYPRTCDLRSVTDKIVASGAAGFALFDRSTSNAIKHVTEPLLQRGIPVVRVFDDCKQTDVAAINFNNIAIGYEAIRTLVNLGHRRIAILNPPTTCPSCTDRIKGAKIAAVELQTDAPLQLSFQELDENDLRAIPTLFSTPHRPTAFFLTQSWILPLLHQVLHRRGYRIPHELSILICSSREKIAPFGTSFDAMFLNFEKVGEKAVLTLKNILDGEPVPTNRLVETTHILRGSLAPPKRFQGRL